MPTREERVKSLLVIKMQGTNRSGNGGGGGKSLLGDPGCESRLGGREKRRAKIINGIQEKSEEKG